jgi:hypothetical protein
MKIQRRTFEANKYPKGSPERNRLNEDPLTSEYMPSYRYIEFIGPEKHKVLFRTKKEAIDNGRHN